MEHIGETIRYHRGRLGLTQEQLAERAGHSPTTIVRLESGEIRNPRLSTVFDISEALGVNLLPFIAQPPAERPEVLGAGTAGRFTAVYQREGDWWIGYVEELPGANAQGQTLEEARESLKEAVVLVLEANKELTRTEFENREVVRESLEISFGA